MTGLFISVEGGEGAGKSTVLSQIHNKLLEKSYDVMITREPGGIEIAEKIREIILDPSHVKMDGRTEALLYAAARRQHLVEKVLPALEEGKIVLCDRFVDSSLAYQGAARGLGMEEVFKINQFAIADCMPQLTLLFQVRPEIGLQRIHANQEREQNRLDLEHIKFHEKVYEAYQELATKFPERIKVINAERDLADVVQDAYHIIETFIQ